MNDEADGLGAELRRIFGKMHPGYELVEFHVTTAAPVESNVVLETFRGIERQYDAWASFTAEEQQEAAEARRARCPSGSLESLFDNPGDDALHMANLRIKAGVALPDAALLLLSGSGTAH